MSAGTLFDAPQAVNLKICRQCGVEKDAGEFYPNCSKCKPCIRQAVRINRANRREQYSAYERDRFHRPERKRQVLESQRRRRARYPEKNGNDLLHSPDLMSAGPSPAGFQNGEPRQAAQSFQPKGRVGHA